MTVQLLHGDCLDVLATLPDASVDAVVTDPPYGLEFMGKEWDAPWKSAGAVIHDPATERGGFQDGNGGNPYSRSRIEYGRGGDASVGFQQWCEAWAAECLRVLKPGGHLLAFGGMRTQHRLACGIEDAGFEIRDSLAYIYGSGFPKSLNVTKALDRIVSADARCVCAACGGARIPQGLGTALKPAMEIIVLARKPLTGTVAGNVLAHGTGALNIDGCRIGTGEDSRGPRPAGEASSATRYADRGATDLAATHGPRGGSPDGRWPANVVLDETAAAMLDEQSGTSISRSGGTSTNALGILNDDGWQARTLPRTGHSDSGGASRFFYTAKADQRERPRVDGAAHPTVKPLDLMRWLVRLVTPPGGTVLDPFAGSGTTAEACIMERFDCITIEREADYLPLIRARIARQLDPVEYVRIVGDPLPTLFDDLDGEAGVLL